MISYPTSVPHFTSTNRSYLSLWCNNVTPGDVLTPSVIMYLAQATQHIQKLTNTLWLIMFYYYFNHTKSFVSNEGVHLAQYWHNLTHMVWSHWALCCMIVTNITFTGSAMVNWNRRLIIQGVKTVIMVNFCAVDPFMRTVRQGSSWWGSS